MCNEALAFTSLEAIDRAKLLGSRALAHYFSGRLDDAMADWTEVINIPETPVEQVAEALFNRGVAWGEKGDSENELADYTRVIQDLKGVQVGQVAQALNNRAYTLDKSGKPEEALKDYTRVIEKMPDAPIEQVAMALVNRGVVWLKKGDKEKAVADYARVVELSGAPPPQLAQAQSGLGWVNYLKNDFVGFLSNTEASLTNDPSLDFASFNLGLALLASGRDADALAAYRAAGERFGKSIDRLALEDLRDATQKWLSTERAEPVLKLLESLKK